MLRQLIPCLILASISSIHPCFSQKQVGIKFNITSPVAHTFNVAGEWAFTPRFSGQVVYFKTNDVTYKNSVFSGYGFTPEARFHFRPQRLKGFFVGPYLRFRYLNWDIPSKGASAKINSTTGGFVVGYQAVIKDILILDFFIGPAFGSHALKITAGVIEDFKLTTITTPVGIRSGIAIGVAVF